MEKKEGDASSDESDFVATEEMLTLAYDDESTINEEDELEDDQEIDNLKAESDMPLEELLKLYGSYGPSAESENEDEEDEDKGDKEEIEVADKEHKEQDYEIEVVDKERDYPEISDNSAKVSFDKSSSQRNNSRLWCKDLIEGSSNYDSEDDGDYIPHVDSKNFANAKTRIGEEYQSNIPPIIEKKPTNDYYVSRIYETLLWSLYNDKEEITNETLREYMENYGKISGIAPLMQGDKDDATALYNLMEHGYDVKESLLHAKNRPAQPSEFPNIMQIWSEQECSEFEKGFETHSKNFRLIRDQRLKSRTIAEIVEFYYFWKKTRRYEDFIKWCKRDKKRPLNQITDYADCLMQDNGRKERYLLGNWNGLGSREDIFEIEENQNAISINKMFNLSSTEAPTVLKGDWNMTTSSLMNESNKICKDNNSLIEKKGNKPENGTISSS